MEEILNSQVESLKIKDFLDSAQNYTKEIFPDLNINNMFTDSLTGKIDNIIK